MIAVADVVHEQPQSSRVVAHDHVDVAVVVDVAERRTATRFRQHERGTGLVGDVLEAAVAEIADQQLALVVRKRLIRSSLMGDDRAVHHEEIEPPVVVEVEPRRTPAGVRQAQRSERRCGARVSKSSRSVVDVQVGALPRELGHEEVFVAVAVEVAGGHPHAGLSFPVGGQCDPREQRRFLERAVTLIDPQQIGFAVVGHVDVDPSVAVEIRRHDAECRPEFSADERLRAHVGECSVAEVAIEPVRPSPVNLRRAVVPRARHVGTFPIVLQRVIDVVADVQIQPAVVIVIEEGGGHRNAWLAPNPTAVRDVGEGSVAVVVEQLVRSKVGEQEVDPAIVVDVRGRDAETVLSRVDAALGRHIREVERAGAVGANLQIVAEQPAGERLGIVRGDQRGPRILVRLQHPPLHDIDVEIPVVVVVEQRDARGEDFRVGELPRRAVEVHEVEARLFSAVGKPRVLCWRAAGVLLCRGGARPVRIAGASHHSERQKRGR